MFVRNENIELSKEYDKIEEQKLEQLLIKNVPILRYHQFKISKLTNEKIEITAPIIENQNHYLTAFGGSISTLGIVTGWAILLYKVQEAKLPLKLVIQKNSIHYKLPIKSNFTSKVEINNENWMEFVETALKQGKAKLSLNIKIFCDGLICAEQECRYAALKID
ncbi:MAG: YiiD C-terminal domain-containing protein [Melioribacteraceae bacterium]|nr:YiiD C-terminal domain-containing protein [Melioribacteraceae bacterium]